MEQYGKQGQSVDELVQVQIRKAKSNGRTIDYDTAYEEVIADSMESMLTDGKVIEKLQQLYKLTMSVGKNGTVNTVYNVGKIKEARSPFSGSKAVTDKSATTVTASDINIPNYQQNVNSDFNSPKSFKIAEDGKNIDCHMNIDVKQNEKGYWFYSFGIEKGAAPQTLHAVVTDKSATSPNNSIPISSQKVNDFNSPKSFKIAEDGKTTVKKGNT